MASMDGQVALVTGGARGIGLAISTKLADRGVKVAVGYSHGADTAKQFAAAHEGVWSLDFLITVPATLV